MNFHPWISVSLTKRVVGRPGDRAGSAEETALRRAEERVYMSFGLFMATAAALFVLVALTGRLIVWVIEHLQD
jgi:hypothetical protein